MDIVTKNSFARAGKATAVLAPLMVLTSLIMTWAGVENRSLGLLVAQGLFVCVVFLFSAALAYVMKGRKERDDKHRER